MEQRRLWLADLSRETIRQAIEYIIQMNNCIHVWQFLGSLQIHLRMLLNASSREVSWLHDMSQRTPLYNDKQWEAKRTVLTCGLQEEKVLRTMFAFLHISSVALLMSRLSSSEQWSTCPRWVTKSENWRRWPKKKNLAANLTLGDNQTHINCIFAALKRRLWSIAKSSHSWRRILKAAGKRARRVMSSA